MPTYSYICTNKKCGFTVDYFLPEPGGMECPKGHAMRRDWRSINVNTTNLRAARG